jgi:L-arabinose isomerase
MWKPLPSLETGAECWILAGGAHHTVLSYGIDAEILRDWARIMGVEFVHIGKDTKVEEFERDLLLSESLWRNA